MGYTGGDIIELTFNHEVEGSGSLFLKSNEDGTMDLGGYASEDDANGITGDGKFIDKINAKRGSYETPPVAWDQNSQDELPKLNAMAKSSILGDWTITSINGAVYGGKGKPVGDLQGNTNTSLITLKLAFEKLELLS